MSKDAKDSATPKDGAKDGEVYDGPDRRSKDRRGTERRKSGSDAKDQERRKPTDRRGSPGRRKVSPPAASPVVQAQALPLGLSQGSACQDAPGAW